LSNVIRAIKSIAKGVSNIFGKGPHPLLWAGSRTIRVKITVSGLNNRCLHSTHVIYECDRRLRNTTWRAAGWTRGLEHRGWTHVD